MAFFGLFGASKPPPEDPTPASDTVEFDEEVVTCRRRGGLIERVRWADLAAVLIQTTADGPAADDFYWLLLGRGMKSGCFVPSEAKGCNLLLERLQKLPGFDNYAVIEAAACVEENRFLCWEVDLVAEVQASLEREIALPPSATQHEMSLREALRSLFELSGVRISLDLRAFQKLYQDVGEQKITLPKEPGMNLRQVLTAVVSQIGGAYVLGPGKIVVTGTSQAGTNAVS